jgi:hypothetical protein
MEKIQFTSSGSAAATSLKNETNYVAWLAGVKKRNDSMACCVL